MLKRLGFRLLFAVLGLIVTLSWWSFRDRFRGNHPQGLDHIPASAWGGGPVKITVEAEATGSATMSMDFSKRDETTDSKLLHTWEKFSAASKTWTVDCPEKVGGYIELDADHPKVGDKLKWRVLINGEQVGQEEWTLDKELEPNTAMFLQLYFDDYAKAPQQVKEIQQLQQQ